MTALLDIANYSLAYRTRGTETTVLSAIDLAVGEGEVLGLVGESGSGKSSLAWAIMRALPSNAREDGGTIRLRGDDLRAMGPAKLLEVRGGRIGMVFQDPATSLNPTLTLGRQIVEVLKQHRGMGRAEAHREAVEALRRVELRDPEALMARYPHEASGGEKQRVGIATAFACRPELVIFDEPTTALDVITGNRILELFRRLRDETGVGGLYISHDLALVQKVADRVAVLDRGHIVEQGDARRIFTAPQADYTKRLVAAVPTPEHRLVDDQPAGGEPLLTAEDIAVTYGRKRLFRDKRVAGNRGISLSIGKGEILGLVGESGSGKSTLAKAITGINRFTGRILYDGRWVEHERQMDRQYRAGIQIVFQHPDASLNPRQTIGEILQRPLRLYGGDVKDVPKLLEQVRLPADFARRYPHQLSGGQKQRVAIARAFAARPRLVICDEITAPLDVSVQASIIELLLELRRAHGTAYMFITHDLNLVRQIAHRLAVIRGGELVDLLNAEDVGAASTHPYTRELMAASSSLVSNG
ncbi:peptide/nickel transport system ATP-binding protein [Faunimonas pinastri]|uniref:Peptide/nickel transport system ATP-binding protein n=1 Tax=Faunimonas pinastri TaxID=1855383 RepID=A0A1H9M147_9HYPH|nr:ABC transporter ATP-binding protein [Faunimonas pinastri]SER17416.1 peptide/nickel transport system ATP-binding protein [Faunimonas pinastri]